MAFFYFFQVLLESKTIRGKISSLPKSIANDKTSFAKGEKIEKLPVGPTKLSPGPTLEMQVKAAVKFVAVSKPSKDMSKAHRISRKMYMRKNTRIS